MCSFKTIIILTKVTEKTTVLLFFALYFHCVSFSLVLLFWSPAITTFSHYLSTAREEMARCSSQNTASILPAGNFVFPTSIIICYLGETNICRREEEQSLERFLWVFQILSQLFFLKESVTCRNPPERQNYRQTQKLPERFLYIDISFSLFSRHIATAFYSHKCVR